MADKYLYRLNIPEDAQTRSKATVQRDVSSQSVLSGSAPDANALGMQPGDLLLSGEYRAKYADKLAREVEELFNATGYNYVPYVDQATDIGGYYALDNVVVEPHDPREPLLQKFDGLLIEKGTRRSHWTRYNYNISQVDHTFGDGSTDTTAYIAVPATGSRVRWYNPTTTATADPESEYIETRTGEFGDVDVYDADAAPADHTALIYDLPYADMGDMDCRVWDDRGVSKTDANGDLAWQKVYRTTHEYTGVPVLENGLVRAVPDEAANSLTVSEWDAANSTWSQVSLGSSNWELLDWDTRSITPGRLFALTEWRDPSQSPTAYYTLRALIHRGWTRIQFDRRGLEDTAIPSGLETLLDPVAATSIKDPGTDLALVKRSEVDS